MSTQRDKRAKRAMRIVWIALIFSLLALLLVSSKQTPLKAPRPSVAPSDYSGLAEQVAWDYLSGHNSSVPVAQGLSASLGRAQSNNTSSNFGVQQLSFISSHFGNAMLSPASKQHPAVYQKWVTDVFQAVTKNGSYSISVDFNLAGSYPVVAAYPTVEPIPSPGTTSSLPPLVPIGTPISPSSSLYKAISSQATAWATAYATNNQVTLYQLSQDQKQQHFLGLGGYTAQNVTVRSATLSGNNTAIALVQVTLQSATNNQLTLTSEYAVLFTQLSAAAPPPVDWGPAGSFSTLRPYGNTLPGLSSVS